MPRGIIPSMSLESENGSSGTPEPEGPGPGGTAEPEGPGPGGTAEPERSGQRWRLLDDPVAIRALAHPLRHELMSIIGRLGRATTAAPAGGVGNSHGRGG